MITHEQRQAVESRGTHLLLAAAAGSGKTFTMVERVLSLLHEGGNIDEMLIITFTRAAAADMKSKLIKRLTDEAEKTPALQHQLRRVEAANIQTIDSFCSEVIKTHFEAANVDPGFRIPDQAELTQLKKKALDTALELAYQENTPDLQALHFGRGVKGVGALVLQMHRFAENRPDPEGFLQYALLDLPQSDGKIWFDELMRSATHVLWDLLLKAKYALSLTEDPLGPSAYAPAIQSDLYQIEEMLRAEDYAQLQRLLLNYEPEKLSGKGSRNLSEEEKEMRERCKVLRTDVKDDVKKLGPSLPDIKRALTDMQQNQPALRALHQLVLCFGEQLDAVKAERSVLSFTDVAHRALRALRHESVARAMRSRFTHIFVDEYQDVSDLQQALVECIQRRDNVFMVGDVKQSIYRFRQAEPSLFIQKYHDFSDSKGGRLIALSQNFRSRSAILDFVNHVFERVMVGGDSEIEYDELARLRPGITAEDGDPPIELAIIADEQIVEEEASGDELEADEPGPAVASIADLVSAESLWIARRVRELLGTRFFDAKKGAWRTLEAHDIAILVRNRTSMRDIERALTAAGIPVYADMNGGYLDALEVQTVKALLTVIENRRRDKELLAVLHSPIGNFQSDQLAEIRLGHREGSYREAMLAYMQREDDPLAERLRALETQLNRWRALSRSLPLNQLVTAVLDESGYYAHVGWMSMGAMRQGNLDLFCTYASDYDSTQTGGLTGFLRYMRQIEKNNDDMDAAHTLGDGDNVVRLITIHKSKGLEYPVVIGADLGRKLRLTPPPGDVALHRDLGCGLPLHDQSLSSRRKTLSQRAIVERIKLEQINEEMRVLYVLLTRAMHQLILVGSVKNAGRDLQIWQAGAENSLTPRNYLDVLAPMILSQKGGNELARTGIASVYVGEARAEVTLTAGAAIQPPVPLITQTEAAIDPGEETSTRVQQALNWQYPYADQVLLPLKLTVSGLTRELIGPTARPTLDRRPKFLTKDGLTNSERGTLTHEALRNLNLARLRGLSGQALFDEVAQQLSHMLERGQLFDKLEPGIVARFIQSPTGQRLLAAERVEREWAFNLRVPLAEATEYEHGGSVLVQGVIDCCFIEDGQWVLLDYKTDRSDDIDALIENYRPQLILYDRALARITGIPVKQKMLCLLRLGQTIEI